MTVLLSSRDTAAFLKLKEQTLANWRATGREDLPYTKVGRLVRYKLADLERYVESRTVAPTAAE